MNLRWIKINSIDLAEVVAESIYCIAITGQPTADLAIENSGYSARCRAVYTRRLFAFFWQFRALYTIDRTAYRKEL